MFTHADPSDFGRINEKRFFEIVRRLQYRAPHWFFTLERATVPTDVRGIDAFALIRKRSDPDTVIRVPIQIKSSKKGIEQHYRKHPSHWVDGVVLLVVNDIRNDREIFTEFLERLFEIWKKDWTYEPFFARLYAEPLDKRGRKIRDELIARDSSRRKKPFSPEN